LMFVWALAIGGAVALTFVLFFDTVRPSASEVAQWLATLAIAFVVTWTFSALNRRIDLGTYFKKCPAGSIYFISGPSLRSFSGTGKVGFRENAMLLKGQLSPNFFWPLVIILVINILSVLLSLSRGKSIVMILSNEKYIGCGGLLAFYILKSYNRYFTRATSVLIEPSSIASVRCRGPVVKIRFQSRPVSSLFAVTFLLPPDLQVEFFQSFDRLFPEKLPQAYPEALKGTVPVSVPHLNI